MRARQGSADINRQRRLSDSKAVGHIALQHHVHNLLRLVIVGVDIEQFWVFPHKPYQRVADNGETVVIVALDVNLDRRKGHLVIQLLETQLSIGEDILIALRILVNHRLGGVVVDSFHDELCIIVGRKLGSVSDMEPGRRHADKRGDTCDAGVGQQYLSERVGSDAGLLQRSRSVQTHLDGKTVAFGFGQNLYVDRGKQQHPGHHRGGTHRQCDFLVAETPVEQPSITVLQSFEETLLHPFHTGLPVRGAFAYQPGGQEWYDKYGVKETACQCNQYHPGEQLDEIPQHIPFENGYGREEHHGNRGGSKQHRVGQLGCRHRRRIPSRVPRPQQIGIPVNHHHRVVHNHTQHSNQCCQSHRVQLKPEEIHDAQRGGNADRHRRRAYQRRAQREEQQHDHNHHEDGFDKVA